MRIYLNGEIVKDSEARISPFDHGFLYGAGLFETFRIYDGKPFLLKEHLARLQKSLKELRIQWDYEQSQIKGILKQLLEANHLENAYVRLNVSGGIGEVGLQTAPYDKPTTIIFMKPLPPRTEAPPKVGVLLKTPRNTPEGAFRLKSHHFLNNIEGKREAGPDPAVEGIFLTEDGFLAEGVVSNLFFVKGGKVFTPALETGILRGITRDFVLSLLEKHHIPYEEGFYRTEDLKLADEAFVTNSIQEIVSLSHIDEVLFSSQSLSNFLKTQYEEAIFQKK